MSQHHATFTWGAGPNSVHVAGGFNNWSATASPLHKQADGTFKGELALPWGEKQAFKYVVDGDWKVREDEAKEWDAAGNMNNVYTAPHAPASAPPAPEPIPVPTSVHHEEKSAPAVTAKDTPAPAAASVEHAPVANAEPSNLLAASAPAPALGAFFLGNPVGSSSTAAPHSTTTTTTTTTLPSSTEKSVAPVVSSAQPSAAPVSQPAPVAPVSQPTPTGPVTQEKTITTAEAIEKTAARANVGEATSQPHEESIIDKASAIGATALAGLGAYIGAAAATVEKVTGVDLTHGQPLTIEEAKAQGLDLNTIQKRDGETDAVSPVNTKPPAAAVDDLSSKIEDLKVGTMSTLPQGTNSAPKNDIPAQNETASNHKTVPMPVVTAISEKDPKKDRTLEANSAIDTAGTKPIGADPSISAKVAKKEAESNPAATGSTLGQTHATSGTASTPVPGPAATGPLKAGESTAVPNRAATNFDAPAPPKKDTSASASALPLAAAQPPAAAGVPIHADIAPSAATAKLPAAQASAPAPLKASIPAAVAPATPTKTAATPAPVVNGTPGSIASTPASTPVKASHKQEGTSGSDVRKRKSSFFHKLKTAFSPKDKENK